MTAKLYLHIGAHRTGTTALQQYLRFNRESLSNNGIQLLVPQETRERPLDQLSLHQSRVIISEENILGTMETNLGLTSLYPDVNKHLARYPRLLNDVYAIYFSVRDLAEWWASSIAFCVSRGMEIPSAKSLEKIAESQRSWNDVIDDIRSSVPNAKLVVREFSFKQDNPKQQLRHLTRWEEWKETSLNKKVRNKRPSTHDIAEALVARSDFDSLSKLPAGEIFQPFDRSQIQALESRYAADMKAMAQRSDIIFWSDSGARINRMHKQPSRAVSPIEPKINEEATTCFLHIGKTGGTFLKSMIEREDADKAQVYLGKHGDTLASTIRDFGRHRKLGFFFRSPEERFTAGFLSRQRQGRPRYNVGWTPAEATAFSFFSSPNELAEALSSSEEGLKSAANFAFDHIFHLKYGYSHYLTSPEALFYERDVGNIVVCCETKGIDRHLDLIFGVFGVHGANDAYSERNKRPDKTEIRLSELAIRNLQIHWATEYDIYEACKSVASALGFAAAKVDDT